MKDIFNKYRQFIIGVLVTLSFLIAIWLVYLFVKDGWRSFAEWFQTDHGTVADWASGIGTIAALAAVIWQQDRQENMERAINVENSRPRFTLSFYPNATKKATVLYWGRNPSEVKEIIEGENPYRLIYIQNISENVIYDFEVILKYHEAKTFKPRTDYWTTSGIGPKENIIIIPKFKKTDKEVEGNIVYDGLFIKFVTTANEVGFFIETNTKQEATDSGFNASQYYYVKGRHIKHVTAINRDKMIRVNSDECRKLDRMFDELAGSTSFMEIDGNGNTN